MATEVDNDAPAFSLSTQEVAARWEVDVEQGLSQQLVRERRDEFGLNELQEAQRRSLWKIFIDQFKSIVILLLVGAAILAFATQRWPEAIALVAVTLVNTAIGFFSEWKAVRSMEALKQLAAQQVRCRREGQEQQCQATELVPGDVVLLGPEDLVPADLRIVTSEQLRVNEAALTGESVPADKTEQAVDKETPLAERRCMLYKGTSLAEGEAVAITVATGMQTELGRISKLAQEAEGQATPLQQKLDKLGHRLAWITIGIAVIVAISGLLVGRDAVLMIETSIALGAAAIPEGLPIVATIALARGMFLMAKRNAIVNRLTAVETLGATRVIFTDKTGTLTENRMTVRRIVTPTDERDFEDDSTKPGAREGKGRSDQQGQSSLQPLIAQVLRNSVLCNNAVLANDDDTDKDQQRGDPTELALLELGRTHNLDRDTLLQDQPEVREVSFDPETMMMATYHRLQSPSSDNGDSEKLLVAVKGAPQAVLQACPLIRDEVDAEPRQMSDEERETWLERGDQLAGEGLRLLAVAEKLVTNQEADPYESLAFLGLIGLLDPPRSDVRQSVTECQDAGIRVVMVTGDRPDTGQAIGEQVGLTKDGKAFHGQELKELEQLSSEQRQQIMQASVFARVTPEQKLNLVKLYQAEGEIVAMTGDGVNDAPALKQADIGVAMGMRGTDAAKQVADMVLRDDQFSTIVSAVKQGRIIFGNIRKSVIFMLCTNLAEILVVTLASLAQAPIPLKPLQILFLNVLTDVFPALALGVGTGGHHVMERPPRDPSEPVLTRSHWFTIGAYSGLVGTCVLIALTLALLALGFEENRAVTVSFLTLAFSKLWFVLNLRDRGTTVWSNDIVRNPWIWGSLILCTALLLTAVYWSPLASVLQTEAPGPGGWLVILGMSLVPALVGIFAPGIRFYSSTENDQQKTTEGTSTEAKQRAA